MNPKYEKAMNMIIEYAPEERDNFLKYRDLENSQSSQFKSFLILLNEGKEDENYNNNLEAFLKLNNYYDKDGNMDFKPMLEQLFDGWEMFNKTHEFMVRRFENTLSDVINSKGLFRNNLTVEKCDAFFEGLNLLLSIRVKCLCYVASASLINRTFMFFPTQEMKKSLLKGQYGVEIEKLPNAIEATKYTALFIENGFFRS